MGFGELELSGNSLFKKNFSGEKLGNVDGVTPPQISIVSNIKIDGRPIGSLGNAEAVWHSDSSLVECPPAGGFLVFERAATSSPQPGLLARHPHPPPMLAVAGYRLCIKHAKFVLAEGKSLHCRCVHLPW